MLLQGPSSHNPINFGVVMVPQYPISSKRKVEPCGRSRRRVAKIVLERGAKVVHHL